MRKIARPCRALSLNWCLMLGLAVIAAVLVTPVSPQEAQPGAPPVQAGGPAVSFSKKPRRAQSRNVVPEEVLALLPWKGIYASGGGLSAPSWRVVVTVEGDLRAGSNARPGSSSTALVDKKRSKLTPVVLAELIALSDRVWREKPGRPPPASPDYVELLVIADGAEVFVLDPHGPITGGMAQRLLDRLKSESASR
jgi:hypothetical protein